MSKLYIPLLALLCCLPLMAVVAIALLVPDQGALAHLAEYMLPRAVGNTLLLALLAGGLALVIGTSTAWAITIYRFPCRRLLEWLLLLPLAMPAYLLAIVYGHLLDVAGPVQSALRDVTGWSTGDYIFPDIRSLPGAALMLGLALYPYVYILARIAFRSQCLSLFESARLLGTGPGDWLWRIALPAARPALMLGLALVVMETLADFGTVSLFGVESFTIAIYRAWYGMADPIAAAKLAALLLVPVAAALWLERRSRHHMQFSPSAATIRRMPHQPVTRWAGILLCTACALPVVLGFAIPAAQLLYWAAQPVNWADALHWQAFATSAFIAVSAAILAIAIATLFAYALRRRHRTATAWLIRSALLGYAIPGSVIAVGIFIPLLAFDKTLAGLIESAGFARPGLLLTGSLTAIILACTIRFLAIAFSSVESGLLQIGRSTDDAAQLLGAQPLELFRRLHWPHLKPSLLIGGFMVFTDSLKELPATLLLRPFNTQTLSVRIYELAGDTRYAEAAIPALMLVGLCVSAVLLLGMQQLGHYSSSATRGNTPSGFGSGVPGTSA